MDEAFTTTRPLPRTVEPVVDPTFAPLCSFRVPERALVTIPGARVRGPYGLVVLPDGSFAGERVAMTPAGRRRLLQNEPSAAMTPPRRLKRRPGSYYPVLGLGVTHYYHWSHDVIMRMRGVADLLPADTMLLVPDAMRPFQIETLALLGLDEHPRQPLPPDACWEVERLHVVTPTLKTQIDSLEPFAWFRDAVKTRYGLADQSGTRRLYLSRRRDHHWRVTNESDVLAVLEPRGFETVEPGTMGLRDQAELFGQASLIVGTGAGLMNMVFSPPSTKILQFQDPGHTVHALWTMAGALAFDYHYMLCEPVANPAGGISDLFVSVDKLERSLAAMDSHA